MNPVMRTTISVSSHPDYSAITGSKSMRPPIMPLTMQRIAMTPEMCYPSYAISMLL